MYRTNNLILSVPFSCLMAMQLALSFCTAPIIPKGRGNVRKYSRRYQGVILVVIIFVSVYKTTPFLLDELNSENAILWVTIFLLICSKRSGRQEFSWIKRYSHNSFFFFNCFLSLLGTKAFQESIFILIADTIQALFDVTHNCSLKSPRLGKHFHLNCSYYTGSFLCNT